MQVYKNNINSKVTNAIQAFLEPVVKSGIPHKIKLNLSNLLLSAIPESELNGGTYQLEKCFETALKNLGIWDGVPLTLKFGPSVNPNNGVILTLRGIPNGGP